MRELSEKIEESEGVRSVVLRNTSLTGSGLAELKPALLKAAPTIKVRTSDALLQHNYCVWIDQISSFVCFELVCAFSGLLLQIDNV